MPQMSFLKRVTLMLLMLLMLLDNVISKPSIFFGCDMLFQPTKLIPMLLLPFLLFVEVMCHKINGVTNASKDPYILHVVR